MISKSNSVALIGAHGYKASYGGFDNLINNIVDKSKNGILYFCYTPSEGNKNVLMPANARRVFINLSGRGASSLLFDFLSILHALLFCRTLFFMGIAPAPFLLFVKLIFWKKIVVNIGGVEWERPQFNRIIRIYLKVCLAITKLTSDVIVIDNNSYRKHFPNNKNVQMIPYGGDLKKYSEKLFDVFCRKYGIFEKSYFLSVSRSIEDNCLRELCETFRANPQLNLVLISNFSNSSYGELVLSEYSKDKNISLINGLYDRAVLDSVRRKAFCYVHTHTLCGTAPSLVEIVHARIPILSIKNPQNVATLHYYSENVEHFFENFEELDAMLKNGIEFGSRIPDFSLVQLYSWERVVESYETIFVDD